MEEISSFTYQSQTEFMEVMDMLDRRLNDKGKIETCGQIIDGIGLSSSLWIGQMCVMGQRQSLHY